MAMASTSNASAPAEASFKLSSGSVYLPPTFLDAIIPGYSVLANFFLTSFGIDVSFYVTLAALSFLASTALRMTIGPVIDILSTSFISTVVVEEYDSIWDDLLKFCAGHPALQNLRALRGHSQGQYFDDDDSDSDDDNNDMRSMQNDLPENAIFNFKDWAARVPPRFEPHSTSGYFWHNGYLFKISREAERLGTEGTIMVQNREKMYISVVWRSAKPIKDLIEEAREISLSKKACTTTIRRPTPKMERGRRNAWQTVAKRPSRPMATVVLDNEQKMRVLEDMNEFLHPNTSRWYANRGIPYRRGYLFHGAPGTGKSSLSFAVAGLFGLDIYCLSLSEVTLTEEDMMVLFNSLPKRCVVLLEDIDCAGISRPKPASEESKKKRKTRKTKESSSTTSTSEDVPEVGPALRRLTNAITISGLLNAIDGVASSEGRLLIMTTNYPDKLDEALVRPGRVDLRVEFKLSNQEQIRELFLRMYCADDTTTNKQPTKIAQVLPQLASGHYGSSDELSKDVLGVTESGKSITGLADEFADALPTETFSPAELQGFLLTRKRNPIKAVHEVGLWRDEQLEKKRINKDERRFKDTGDEAFKEVNGLLKPGNETDDSRGDDDGDGSDDSGLGWRRGAVKDMIPC